MTNEALGNIGVPLAWLAGLDDLPAPGALPGAFGDSYLYRYNPVYRSIRDAALNLGYVFSSADTPLWRDYQSMSLLVLHRILTDRIIPYSDTATTVRRVLEANPRTFFSPRFFVANLKPNRAFHESAHCVAHSVLDRMCKELRSVEPCDSRRFVLESIFAESFANTVEYLGSARRHMPISDAVFYTLNSYYWPGRKRAKLVNDTAIEVGAERLFGLVFFSYFEANLTAQPMTDSTCNRIAQAADCVLGQIPIAKKIAATCFTLNIGFRENATPAYFEFHGRDKELRWLSEAGWLDAEENRRFARALCQTLWEASGRV